MDAAFHFTFVLGLGHAAGGNQEAIVLGALAIGLLLFLMTYTEHHKEHMDQSPGHLSSGADAQTDHRVEDASGEGSQRNPLQPRSHLCVDCRLDSRIDG